MLALSVINRLTFAGVAGWSRAYSLPFFSAVYHLKIMYHYALLFCLGSLLRPLTSKRDFVNLFSYLNSNSVPRFNPLRAGSKYIRISDFASNANEEKISFYISSGR